MGDPSTEMLIRSLGGFLARVMCKINIVLCINRSGSNSFA